jgi:hypothetical protein
LPSKRVMFFGPPCRFVKLVKCHTYGLEFLGKLRISCFLAKTLLI